MMEAVLALALERTLHYSTRIMRCLLLEKKDTDRWCLSCIITNSDGDAIELYVDNIS